MKLGQLRHRQTRWAQSGLCALICLSAAASTAVGQTTTSFRDGENGYSAARDTKILATSPGMNYGSATDIELDGDSDKGGLLYWDVTSIPAGSFVASVQIIANVIDISSSGYHVYESKRPWEEGSATWNEFATGQAWQTAGAQGAGDRGSDILATLSSGSTGVQSWAVNADGIAVVQNWVDNPVANMGFVVQNYTPTNGLDIETRESTTVANRPAISITYYAPGEDITPTASFDFDPPVALAGTEIHFDASGSDDLDGSITQFDWAFGDGGSDTGVMPNHTYSTPGSYMAELIVTDDDAKSDTTTRLVTIGPAGPSVFAILGDFGDDGPELDDVAALAKSWNPDFFVTAGDNNYPDGEASTIEDNLGQHFSNFIYPYTGSHGSTATMNRFYPSLGNHDWHTISCSGGVCNGAHFDYLTLPGNERYYEFLWGDVHFFAIDSDTDEPDGTSSTSTQAQWLQAAMAASDATWKVVYFHHAAYSSSSNHGSTTRMQWPFADWGADAVIGGHDHTYERIHRDGIVYFVNGLGGRSIYGLGTPIAGSAIQYNGDFGAMRALADSVSLTFEFWNRADSLVDSYTLTNQVSLQATVWLEGPYNATGDSMVVDLDHLSEVPTGVVDSVRVELRTGDPMSPPMAIVAERTGLLTPDGSVVDTTGSELVFAGVPDGDHYVVVRHRNHLGVMTATPVGLAGGAPSAVDFGAPGSAYGVNPMKELEPGVWGLFAADATGDGQVTASDFNLWLTATKAVVTGYQVTDFNLNSSVTASDFNLWLANTKAAAQSQVPPP